MKTILHIFLASGDALLYSPPHKLIFLVLPFYQCFLIELKSNIYMKNIKKTMS